MTITFLKQIVCISFVLSPYTTTPFTQPIFLEYFQYRTDKSITQNELASVVLLPRFHTNSYNLQFYFRASSYHTAQVHSTFTWLNRPLMFSSCTHISDTIKSHELCSPNTSPSSPLLHDSTIQDSFSHLDDIIVQPSGPTPCFPVNSTQQGGQFTLVTWEFSSLVTPNRTSQEILIVEEPN